jgi:hypothetical protein
MPCLPTANLALALNDFYEASVTLRSTLNLDPTVTLLPEGRELARRDLVRSDFGVMLALAVQWRLDLQSVNILLVAAANDDTKAGRFGSRTATQVFPWLWQETSSANVAWVFNPVVFGQIPLGSPFSIRAPPRRSRDRWSSQPGTGAPSTRKRDYQLQQISNESAGEPNERGSVASKRGQVWQECNER